MFILLYIKNRSRSLLYITRHLIEAPSSRRQANTGGSFSRPAPLSRCICAASLPPRTLLMRGRLAACLLPLRANGAVVSASRLNIFRVALHLYAAVYMYSSSYPWYPNCSCSGDLVLVHIYQVLVYWYQVPGV